MLELLVAVGLILLSRTTIGDIISVSNLAKGLISRIGEKDAFGILKKAIDKTARESEEAEIKEILVGLKGKEDLLHEFRAVNEEAKRELVSKYFKRRSDVLEQLAKNYYVLFCREAIKKDRPFREFVVIELGKLASQGVITDEAVKRVEIHLKGIIEETKREKEAASRQFIITDGYLEKRLERIKDLCSRNLSYIHSLGLFKHYTNHGPAHSEAVIKLLEKLTESCELSGYEIFILKSAAWCHDLGMLKMDDEDRDFDDPEVCEMVRKKHHKRTVKYIQKHREELGLRKTESIILEWICCAHSSKVNIKEVKEEYSLTIEGGRDEKVRTRFLSALLRIADALDAREDRLPPEGYMNIPGIPEASYREYWKHEVVKEVDIRGREIIIGIVEKYEYPEGVNVVEEVKEKLTEELNSVKDVLEARGLKFDMKIRVYEAPVKKELPVAAERGVKAHAVVTSEDELKIVLKNPKFIETPFWKGFSSWEDFKSTVYDAFYKFKEISEGQIAVVYGDMGIGKTTYMLWLVRKLIEGAEEVIFLNAYEIETALREVKHELNKFFVIDALGRALKHGESASAFEKRCKDIIKFAKENRAKFIITMRTHEKDIFYKVVRGEGYEFIDIGPERIKPRKEDMYRIIANHLKHFKVNIAGFRPEQAYGLIYSDKFKEYEELFKAVEMLIGKSTGAPFYIRHAISEFEGRRMELRDIEKLPRGVENLVMMTVESFLKGDDSDKNFIKMLITISKLRDFSYDFYEAICGEIGVDEERRNAFERFLLRGDFSRYALPSYWKESVDKAIERDIENMELAGKFRDANKDFPSVEEFLRAKLMDWVNKASNNRKKLCSLLADAAINAPILDVDLLYFANKHFEKEWGEKECDYTRILLALEFFYLGNVLYESEMFNESIKAYKILIYLNPIAINYYNRGTAYAEINEQERAIEDYSKAIELNPDFAEAYNNRGNAYHRLSQHERAIEDYNKAIELNPNDTGAYNNRGTAYAEINEQERAIEDYSKAIEINPNYAEAYYNRGLAYAEINDQERAIEDYSKAVELNPDFAETYYNRGNAYHGLKQQERAIEDYSKAIELNPNYAEAYYNRGLSYAGLNEQERAIEDYSKAIELNPNYVEAYNNRGNAYHGLKQHERAIEDCSKAIELNPNYVEAYNNRGLAYAELNQHKRAIEDYSKAIEINPNYAKAYSNRGLAYAELNQHKRAIDDYSKAIELNPNYAKAYSNRGLAYAELNQHKRAIDDYSKAIELNPNYVEAYNNRGNTYVEINEQERAIEDYSKAIELNPDFAEAYYNRGNAYARLNEQERAIEDYSKAIELNPDFAEAYYNRGNAYHGLKQHERAIEDYSKAIELNPDFAGAYNNRGNAYAKINEQERAIEDYSKAVEINPNYAEAYYNRGDTYGEINEQKRAIEDYSKAIELNPDFAEAYYNRGTAYAELNEQERAIEDYSKAIELNPNYVKAYYNRGTAYYGLNQRERAIEDYSKAIELNPDFAEAYYNRGTAYYRLKQQERAIEDYSKTIELNPNLAEAYTNRGLAYAELNQHKRAIEDYNKAIELNPNLAESYNNRGIAYARLNEHKRAIEDYSKSIELNPNYAEVYVNRGKALSEIGRYEKAARDFKEAGILFLSSEKVDDSVKHFSFCFELREEIVSDDVIYCSLALFLITLNPDVIIALKKMQIQDETLRKIFELTLMKLRDENISEGIAMLEEKEKRKEMKILFELLKYF